MTTVQPIPDQSEAVLRDLMQVLIDGQKGFARAAESLEEDGHSDLAQTMSEYAEQRQRLAAQLQEAASAYVTLSDVEGSTTADLHRAWMGLADAVTGDDPHAVLAVAEQGEDRAKSAYTDAMKEDLPEELRAVVARQSDEVIEAHDRVRDLRDQHAS
jgi:uncharacterized protein (TIGR02284 family)